MDKGKFSDSNLRRDERPDHLRCALARPPGIHCGEGALEHLRIQPNQGLLLHLFTLY